MEINEGNAVIVEPHGAIGIVSMVIPFGIDEIDYNKFHCNSIEEWQDYWFTNHKFNIGSFDKVIRVLFIGTEHTYDYPITTIRKVVNLKKFNKIYKWHIRYNINYISFWRIFKRLHFFICRLKENRDCRKCIRDLGI